MHCFQPILFFHSPLREKKKHTNNNNNNNIDYKHTERKQKIFEEVFYLTISHLHIHIITWAIPVLITTNHLCTILFFIFFINTLWERAQIYLFACLSLCVCLSIYLCLVVFFPFLFFSSFLPVHTFIFPFHRCVDCWCAVVYFGFNTCYNRIGACAPGNNFNIAN